MVTIAYPVIDLAATGRNILRLRLERQLSVRDLQLYFGFEQPQAIYKWQSGRSLPTVDNLLALSVLLGVPMEQILVYRNAQQGIPCCASRFWGTMGMAEYLLHIGRGHDPAGCQETGHSGRVQRASRRIPKKEGETMENRPKRLRGLSEGELPRRGKRSHLGVRQGAYWLAMT